MRTYTTNVTEYKCGECEHKLVPNGCKIFYNPALAWLSGVCMAQEINLDKWRNKLDEHDKEKT